MTPPSHTDIQDAGHLAARQRVALLGNRAEPSFDRLAQLAARILQVPIALVSLIDRDHQVLKSCVGLGEPWSTRREAPLSRSFCQHVVASREPLIVADARDDPYFKDTIEIADLGFVAYAGIPLITGDGYPLGSFCVIDTQPHMWTHDEIAILKDLAASVMTEIDLRTEILERRQAEGALRASEERFRMLFEHSPDAIWLLDAPPPGETAYIVDCNQAACRMHGYNRLEILGQPMEMLAVVPHDPERLTRNTIRMKDFWSTGRLTGEDQHRCKDGTVIDIEYALAGVTIDGRDLMLGIDRDITARKRMEQALSESEERFRSLVSNIPGAIYRCVNDENWTMVFISSRIEELSGYPAADFIGNARRTYASIIYPEDQEFVATHVTQALEEQRPYRLEYRVAHADGTIRWVYEEGRGVFSTDGRLLWMDGVVLDNTARKQAEVALQESEARYRAMLDAIPDLMFRFTRDGTFLDYKAPAEMIPVSPPEALLGMRIEDVVPAEVNRQIMAASAQVLETGALQVLEYKLRIAETDRDFDARLVQYKTDQIFMIVRDVTERAHLEENLRLAKEDAERANAAKSEFLSRMSHELRTPLNAILGFAQLLELEVLSPDERESVEHILKAGQHLLQLINEVLEISRIETGNLSLSIEPVDIQEVLRETLDLVHPLAARVQVKLPSSLSTSYTSYVQADRQRLKQVLLNLLSNAVKYNRQFGTVDVECRTTIDNRLRILITDTGHGITTDQMDRLFTPFERLGAAQGEVEGSGLGLALSRRLIEVMGGTIGVKSIPGDGSTFWIELPHATAPVDQLAPAEATPYDSPRELGPRATILYIEDNLANLQLIERLLTMRTEIHLLPAMQGRLGLDLAREHRPDVILLDLHLPDLPGWEVLAQLQADARTRDIPVLVISADATSRQIEHLREAGAYDYITKPLDVHHFLAVLDEILRKTAGERGHQAGLSPDAP